MTEVRYDLVRNILWVGPERITGWKWPNMPGLLFETETLVSETGGARWWNVSESLKPGDKLHVGNLHGVFTNEQHWGMIEICRIADAHRHRLLLIALRDVSQEYNLFSRHERKVGPPGRHRARLTTIYSQLMRLRPLLGEEPLLPRLLAPEETDAGIEAGEQNAAVLCKLLVVLETSTARAVADRQVFARLRNESHKPAATGKRPERRFIWERSFELWRALGNRVGYTEDGPVLGFLEIIHQAVGIAPPVGESVRQAIDDFHERPRPHRKTSHGAAPKKR